MLEGERRSVDLMVHDDDNKTRGRGFESFVRDGRRRS